MKHISEEQKQGRMGSQQGPVHCERPPPPPPGVGSLSSSTALQVIETPLERPRDCAPIGAFLDSMGVPCVHACTSALVGQYKLLPHFELTPSLSTLRLQVWGLCSPRWPNLGASAGNKHFLMIKRGPHSRQATFHELERFCEGERLWLSCKCWRPAWTARRARSYSQ